MILERILPFTHRLVARFLHAGDCAIDATVGNGHDTLTLGQIVGPTGQVYGFDVQANALERTRHLLAAQNMMDRVNLIQAGHETLRKHLPASHHGHVRVVMFNLGYLPHSDKTRITQPETTLPALDAAFEVLAPNGLIAIVIYRGHPGGSEEAAAVLHWARLRDQRRAHVLQYQFINQEHTPPILVAIEKRAG